MNALFKAFVFTFSLVLLFVRCDKEPDPNEPVDIPDQYFLDALLEDGVDTNGDGKISHGEASHVTLIDVRVNAISEMTGLEAFVNLDTLWCTDNKLRSLDISKNTLLSSLRCAHNQLSSLDISNNTALTGLYIDGMSTLSEVCVWTMPFPPGCVTVHSEDSPNVYFTTECGIVFEKQ